MFKDAIELIQELLQAGASFMLVGGHAIAVHGHVRATLDVDLFLEANPANAQRIVTALQNWGAPLRAHGVTVDSFSHPGAIYQLGLPPQRIDLLTFIDGVSFEEAKQGQIEVELAGVKVPVIGLESLLKNKKSSGRLQDLADIDALESCMSKSGTKSRD